MCRFCKISKLKLASYNKNYLKWQKKKSKINIEKKRISEIIETKYKPICPYSMIYDGYIMRKSTWEVRK